jgi:hypothetical protein
MRSAPGWALIVGVFAIIGCSEPEGCTLELRYAIEVQVRDATTQGLLASYPYGVVRDGDYQDSLRVAGNPAPVPSALVAASERPGVYAVHIEAAGYAPWDTAGVGVPSDECHVRTASFTAWLEPAS